jgi:hypothetical protein
MASVFPAPRFDADELDQWLAVCGDDDFLASDRGLCQLG